MTDESLLKKGKEQTIAVDASGVRPAPHTVERCALALLLRPLTLRRSFYSLYEFNAEPQCKRRASRP